MMRNPKNGNKFKKEVKWYTYVDKLLDNKLKIFMDQFNIKNQAKLIRDSVNNYIDLIDYIYQKEIQQKEYNEEEINKIVKNAIDNNDLSLNLNKELKQKISPLKTAILLLKNFKQNPDKINEIIEDANQALMILENTITQLFQENNPRRYIKNFDILYIEDNELDRKTIQKYFELKNLEIKAVETSEEGNNILRNATPNVILLDIELKTSKINGDKFCKILKLNDIYKNIPVILISALVSEREKKEIMEKTGADDIIIKPINQLNDLDILFKYIN